MREIIPNEDKIVIVRVIYYVPFLWDGICVRIIFISIIGEYFAELKTKTSRFVLETMDDRTQIIISNLNKSFNKENEMLVMSRIDSFLTFQK